MFYDEILRTPRNEEEMWEILREQFWLVREVLWQLPVQERKHITGDEDWPWPRFVSYRGKPPADPRDGVLKSAQKLLPLVHQLLDEKTITPEFIQSWGKIMYYHGFVASYVVGAPDAMGHVVGGENRAAATRARRKWIAKIMLPRMNGGMTREQAEDHVVELIKEILAGNNLQLPFDADWYRSFLSKTEFGINQTFNAKHFSKKEMIQLQKEPDDDIPPYRSSK